MQVGNSHVVHKFGVVVGAIKTDAISRRATVRYEVCVKTKIAGHPRSGLDAHVGKETDNHKSLDSFAAQLNFKIGANEPAVDIFFNTNVGWLHFEALFLCTCRE